MCVAHHFTWSWPFAADITSAVGPLTSVPGIAERLPSVRATPAFLPVGKAPVTMPIRLWTLLVYWSSEVLMSLLM